MIKSRFDDFKKDRLQYGSCLCNIILCICMAYFYYDSSIYAPLIYSIFFAAYCLLVFILGRKVIPILYIIFIVGATQDITFINCTGFFLILGLSSYFPAWKIPLFIVYALDICLVCFRHDKSVLHLLAHFAFCTIFYFAAEHIKKKIEDSAKGSFFSDKKLDIKDEELKILNALASGYKQKEIDGYSEQTVSRKLKDIRNRNDCVNNDELIFRYRAEILQGRVSSD